MSAPVELASAATNVLVAGVALACAGSLGELARHYPWRARVWSLVFVLVAFAAALGVISHGIALPRALHDLIWHPLYLALGLTVALFGAGVVDHALGERASRLATPFLVALGVGFYLYRWLTYRAFLAFILYEATVMVIALAVYTTLAARGRLPGAWTLSAGVLVTILAAVIQATRISLVPTWPVDHNGLFHLVQIPGLLLLAAGLRAAARPHGS